MKTPKWRKSVAQIVNKIDDETGVGWDTDSTLNILTSFIEENCDQREFEKHVRRIAASDLKNSK